MRVGRHHGAPRALSLARERADQLPHLPLKDGDPPSDVEAKVQRDLLVPRSPRVELAPEIPKRVYELALDERVNVLVVSRDEGRIAPGAIGERGHRGAQLR